MFLNIKLTDIVFQCVCPNFIYIYNWLQQDSKLQLGKVEIWNKGEERELVLHLLKFTQVREYLNELDANVG